MNFTEGDIVHEKNTSNTYRVHRIEGKGAVTCFGGQRHQWRTLLVDSLRAADKKETARFLRAEAVLKAQLPKPTVKVNGRR